ncbi:hypothetical protein ADUPG1_008838 [Aduncisulcus paluster]|uniref:Uncharacterized protein n=1 Tax=Aduncisulcus paluster TaxID=2918883 RepID=A0ABQ5KVP8_9EUKA|nr:hypothetical protein ADUPG1_008838 [Aduncisulcus paluster]
MPQKHTYNSEFGSSAPLYARTLAIHARKEKKIKAKKQAMIEDEISQCSFKPKINAVSQLLYREIGHHERWEQRRRASIERKRQQLRQTEEKACTGHPIISERSRRLAQKGNRSKTPFSERLSHQPKKKYSDQPSTPSQSLRPIDKGYNRSRSAHARISRQVSASDRLYRQAKEREERLELKRRLVVAQEMETINQMRRELHKRTHQSSFDLPSSPEQRGSNTSDSYLSPSSRGHSQAPVKSHRRARSLHSLSPTYREHMFKKEFAQSAAKARDQQQRSSHTSSHGVSRPSHGRSKSLSSREQGLSASPQFSSGSSPRSKDTFRSLIERGRLNAERKEELRQQALFRIRKSSIPTINTRSKQIATTMVEKTGKSITDRLSRGIHNVKDSTLKELLDKELKEFTFKPTISNISLGIDEEIKRKDLIFEGDSERESDRRELIGKRHQRHKEKMEKLKQQLIEEEMSDCTFSPRISPSPQNILHSASGSVIGIDSPVQDQSHRRSSLSDGSKRMSASMMRTSNSEHSLHSPLKHQLYTNPYLAQVDAMSFERDRGMSLSSISNADSHADSEMTDPAPVPQSGEEDAIAQHPMPETIEEGAGHISPSVIRTQTAVPQHPSKSHGVSAAALAASKSPGKHREDMWKSYSFSQPSHTRPFHSSASFSSSSNERGQSGSGGSGQPQMGSYSTLPPHSSFSPQQHSYSMKTLARELRDRERREELIRLERRKKQDLEDRETRQRKERARKQWEQREKEEWKRFQKERVVPRKELSTSTQNLGGVKASSAATLAAGGQNRGYSNPHAQHRIPIREGEKKDRTDLELESQRWGELREMEREKERAKAREMLRMTLSSSMNMNGQPQRSPHPHAPSNPIASEEPLISSPSVQQVVGDDSASYGAQVSGEGYINPEDLEDGSGVVICPSPNPPPRPVGHSQYYLQQQERKKKSGLIAPPKVKEFVTSSRPGATGSPPGALQSSAGSDNPLPNGRVVPSPHSSSTVSSHTRIGAHNNMIHQDQHTLLTTIGSSSSSSAHSHDILMDDHFDSVHHTMGSSSTGAHGTNTEDDEWFEGVLESLVGKRGVEKLIVDDL